MAAKHSPSKAQQFGGDSQLPETLEFSLVILKQFSPSFQSRLLADLTNGFSLPEAESSFYYCFVYEPPWVSTSSPVLQQIASSSPSPSSCGKLLSSTYSPQSVPNKTQLSCEHRWQEASCPFPSSLDCKSWEYLFDWGFFSVISAGFPGWTQEYIPQPEAAACDPPSASFTNSEFYSSSS